MSCVRLMIAPVTGRPENFIAPLALVPALRVEGTLGVYGRRRGDGVEDLCRSSPAGATGGWRQPVGIPPTEPGLRVPFMIAAKNPGVVCGSSRKWRRRSVRAGADAYMPGRASSNKSPSLA